MARMAIVLAAALLISAPACAGSFEVAPITLDLQPGKASLLYISNTDAVPVTIQIQAMDWKQSAGADTLAPSDTLVASPPLVRIAPGERQVVRVLAVAPDAEGERQYRLLLSELPESDRQGSGVRVLLQLNIPVFVSRREAPPHVTWFARAGIGATEIFANNDGGAAIKIARATVSGDGAPKQDFIRQLTYLLPGTECHWLMTGHGAPWLHITARDLRSGTSFDADVPVLR